MTILLTGASGTICTKLSHKLIENNYRVKFLSANLNKTSENQNIFYWNAKDSILDDRSLDGVDTIVHLAGAGIANARWTTERKQELRDSRIKTATLIHSKIKRLNKKIKKYISASAIGIYPDGVLNANEDYPAGDDFMSILCLDWEKTLSLFNEEGSQTVALRTGIVLDRKSGFYNEIAKLAAYYLAAIPGSGQQWVSWISMDDIVNMYYQAIVDDSVEGVYNATSPAPERLETVIKAICDNESKRLILPNIPPFILKIIYGEMSSVILSDKHVLPDKWLSEGRKIKYSTLTEAIESL